MAVGGMGVLVGTALGLGAGVFEITGWNVGEACSVLPNIDTSLLAVAAGEEQATSVMTAIIK